jgi:hypothetical protein
MDSDLPVMSLDELLDSVGLDRLNFYDINNHTDMTQINSMPTLDELLDSLGFSEWITFTASFVMPLLCLIGIILCSISVFIFFRPCFLSSIYFYYRFLCIVYIIHLIHGLPLSLLFSPRYFPSMNTYISSMYLIYYGFISTLLFHFANILQMANLLDRMKMFSPFLMRHFSTSPRIVSLAIFLTCFLIDSPAAFLLKIKSFGTYYYFVSLDQKQSAAFFYVDPSDFSSTSFLKIILIFTQFFKSISYTRYWRHVKYGISA